MARNVGSESDTMAAEEAEAAEEERVAGACEIVHWHFSSRMLGRSCKLDASHNIKFPMPKHYPVHDFSGAEVVLPSAGVAVSIRQRPGLPFAASRLRSMWKVKGSLLDTGGVSNATETCLLCSTMGQETLVDSVVLKCPLCLLSFHPECSRALQSHLGIVEGDAGKLDWARLLPSSFDALCHSCSALTQRPLRRAFCIGGAGGGFAVAAVAVSSCPALRAHQHRFA
jgi:hypothetical protein